MTDLAAAANDALAAASPALYELVSPLGRRAYFPPDIPYQAAQARGKTYNATIGQITDGYGQAVPVAALAAGLAAMPAGARNRALLYSPVEGIAEVRRAWRAWQRREVPDDLPSSLPLVTAGLTHGLALAADLFAGEGRAVAVAAPFWGNYRQTFALRHGARMLAAPAYRDGRFAANAWSEALADVPVGEPAVAILNLPSNPGGYSPTVRERETMVAGLFTEADRRPLLVICDDAYTGLVFEDDVPRSSPFWDLVGLHPNLVPVKVDGATKEYSFFGGRVGFLTFACEPGSDLATALESKVKGLLRAVMGSPIATSQMLLLAALEAPDAEAQVEGVRLLLAERYRALQLALSKVDSRILQPQPFNSGCFALVELPEALGVTAEEVRQHLLDHYDTGVVAVGQRYLRVAFCSVAAAAIPELVGRMERGVAERAAERVRGGSG
ncbi:MAG TPA: aminotransferase class I/II-fold pyridoxal phosphate-dependent enzyme [Thermoanaerobaculia bacterium]|jgi:aspartate/methionine/tyrosine aminotransferase|nr:aminotransferase class I/II-fold pyridoxal phosphate-dependent enzyme [Thermoanaerobaculia bacterium]